MFRPNQELLPELVLKCNVNTQTAFRGSYWNCIGIIFPTFSQPNGNFCFLISITTHDWRRRDGNPYRRLTKKIQCEYQAIYIDGVYVSSGEGGGLSSRSGCFSAVIWIYWCFFFSSFKQWDSNQVVAVASRRPLPEHPRRPPGWAAPLTWRPSLLAQP